MRVISMVLGLSLVLLAAPAAPAAEKRTGEKLAVDLALVLAVDVSLSIDEGEKDRKSVV